MNLQMFGDNPAIGYLQAFLGVRFAAFGEARRRGDVGASAIELAVITAVLVLLAVTITLVVKAVTKNACNKLQTAASKGSLSGGNCNVGN
jgi:hypothetical protein